MEMSVDRQSTPLDRQTTYLQIVIANSNRHILKEILFDPIWYSMISSFALILNAELQVIPNNLLYHFSKLTAKGFWPNKSFANQFIYIYLIISYQILLHYFPFDLETSDNRPFTETFKYHPFSDWKFIWTIKSFFGKNGGRLTPRLMLRK